MYTDRHQYPEQPQAVPGHPAPHYVVAAPMAYPVGPDGGGVLYVNGVPQPLSRRSSRVMIGAIVFATCVVPLVIIAAVLLMMPDFDSMFSSTTSGAVPSVTIPSR